MPGVRTTSWLYAVTASLLFATGFHGEASALPYILEAPIILTGSELGNPGVKGSLETVALGSSLSNPRGIETGDTSFVTNDVFVFRLTLDGDSLPVDMVQLAIASTPFFGNPKGAGAFDEVADQAPSSASLPMFGFRADFAFAGASLEPGESSTRLFITFGPAGSALDVGRTASFTLSAGTDFTVQSTIVPEPETMALIALGLAGLGFYGRKRNSQR